jgi:transposase-like protein
MPGPTTCPFCQSSEIAPASPVQDLREYACVSCGRTWLVAGRKRQAKIVEFPRRRRTVKRRKENIS